MEGIKVTVGGRKLLFATTGELADASGAAPVAKGKWRADSTEKDNKLRYDIAGAAQTPIQAVYSFTSDNQLQVVLKGDTDSAAFVFPGGIEIDKNHDFQYHIINSTGADTGVFFTLYGKIEFEETSNDLVVHLTGGGEAHVAGDSGAQSLEAAKNHIATFKADDLLAYQASTVNVFPGQQDAIIKPAILDFVGTWDIQDGTIVFLSEIKSSGGNNDVTLAFGGKFKAVSVGFVYHTDGNTTDVAFNISGQHVFRSDRATTDFAWETSLGFSDKKFNAQISVSSTTTFNDGRSLQITGGLKFQKDQSGTTFDLNLAATYKFEAGTLVFRADIKDDGSQISYDLMLQGTFVYKNLHLSFSVELGSAAGVNTLAVTVGIQGNRESMIKNIALALNISGSEAKLQLNFTFEARLHFVNGKRVVEKKAPAIAQPNPN